MSRRYEISNPTGAAMSSALKTFLSLISTAAIRPRIYEFDVGTNQAPADNFMEVVAARETAMTAGTSNTAVTPNPLDSLDPAATATAGGNWSAEPTIGVTLFDVGLNQRATFRWVAAPFCELVCPATASAGIGIRALNGAATGDIRVTVYYEE